MCGRIHGARVDSGTISAALLSLVLILLYILGTSITLISILKSGVKSLINDIVNFASKVFDTIKNNSASDELDQLKGQVKTKLLKLNETFTKILLNITRVLLNYVDNTTITDNSLTITSELNTSRTLPYLNITN